MKRVVYLTNYLFFLVFSTPLALVVWFFQLKSVHYSLLFMSWYFRNPTFEQSKVISTARVMDANIFAGERLMNGVNIYDFTPYAPIGSAYFYPPLFAFLGYYLDKLGYTPSHLIWEGLIIFSFYLFLLLGAYYIYKSKHKVWLSLSFLVIGALSQLMLGQINYGHYFLFLLPLLFGIFLTENVFLLSLFLGSAIGITLYALFYLPLVYIKRGFRPVIFALGLGLLLQFPLIFNLKSALSYPGFILSSNKLLLETKIEFFRNRTFLYQISPILDLIFLITILLITLIVLLNYLGKKKTARIADIFSFFIASSLMIDPYVSDHHLTLIYLIYALNFSRLSFFLIFPYLFSVNDLNLSIYNLNPKVFGFLVNETLRQVGVLITFAYTLYLVKDYLNVRNVFTSVLSHFKNQRKNQEKTNGE